MENHVNLRWWGDFPCISL